MRLLRQNFHLIGLDPNFRVLDADESLLLRRQIGRELLRDRFEGDDSGAFHRFVDGYGKGNESEILRHLLRIHDLMTSLVDPQDWLEQSRRRIRLATFGTLADTELGAELCTLIRHGLESMKQQCKDAQRQAGRLGFYKSAQYVDRLAEIVFAWARVFFEKGLDGLTDAVNSLNLDKLPSEKGSDADKALVKTAIDGVRDQMKEGPWRNLLRFTTKEWQEGLQQILPHVDLFIDLVSQFQSRYESAKLRERALDFADLERQTLHILQKSEGMVLAPSLAARGYHRRFAHVLVDEYQDINQVQDAILNLVSRECVAGQDGIVPNLFCVGDVKQSIYRFRLADLKQFLQRQNQYRDGDSHGLLIDLQSNFRSRAPLLEAINEVFKRLMTATETEIDYDESHHLKPGLTYPPAGKSPVFSGAPIELHVLATRGRAEQQRDRQAEDEEEAQEIEDLDRTEREALLVARRIRRIVGADGEPAMHVMDKDNGRENLAPRKAKHGDIVILLRANKYKAGQFAQILRRQGIPVHADSGSGFFESTEVRDMLALLELLENRRQDIPLATVLRSPLISLLNADDAMARIRAAYPATKTRSAFHEAVLRYAAKREDDLSAELRGFFAHLDRWRQVSARRPLAEVIWQIYRETGYLAYVAGLIDGQQREANLVYLHQRAAQFGNFGQHGIAGFLSFLRELEDASDLGPPSVVSQAENVVRIMSVHRSKGQEFPIVIVADLGKAINHQDSSGPILADRDAKLGMSVVDEYRNCRYPSLALALVRERVRRQTMAEELRVLYVAMTRAKEHLILVGTASKKKPDEWITQWAGHQGPMPAEVILGARSMLDWLGPVAAATNGVLEIVRHSWDEVRGWEVAASQRQNFTPEQQAMARLEPLETDPPIPPVAAKVIRRVAFEYPFKFYSELPAAQSVTARTHATSAQNSGSRASHSVVSALADSVSRTAEDASAKADPTQQHSDPLPRYSGGGLGRGVGANRASSTQPPPQPSPGIPREGEITAPSLRLSQPNFLVKERPLSAADKGTATHLVLEHFNFVRGGDPADIESQIQHLVARKMMTAAQAAAVDRGAIRWFLQTDLGQLLARHSANLIRELPLYFPDEVNPEGSVPSNDPLDRIMIRGRLDLLLPLDEGAILIDYKTDAISPEEVPARGEFYRPQLEAYAQAFEKITSKSVSKILLVFLSPRIVHELT